MSILSNKPIMSSTPLSNCCSPGCPGLTREHFVNLLEYCEERLKVKRVLACFDKSEIDPREGIPRALKCIGFSVLPPNRFPNWLDSKTTFAMVYLI